MKKINKSGSCISKCIILTTLCNNNCRLCLVGDIKKEHKRISALRGELNEGIKKGCKRVILTGGEPTIHPDFLKVIRLCKDLGYKKITVISNGRMFSNISFLKKAIEEGMDEVVFSIYSSDSGIHDYLTMVPGSLRETAAGLENMKKLQQPVIINTAISKKNYKHLPELSKMLAGLGAEQQQFEFVRPIGMAQKNYSFVVPEMNHVVNYVHKAIDICIKNGVRAKVEGIPFCLMKGYTRYVNTLEEQKNNDMSEEDIKSHIKFKKCQICKYYQICTGVWKEYTQRMGDKEFLPVRF